MAWYMKLFATYNVRRLMSFLTRAMLIERNDCRAYFNNYFDLEVEYVDEMASPVPNETSDKCRWSLTILVQRTVLIVSMANWSYTTYRYRGQ